MFLALTVSAPSFASDVVGHSADVVGHSAEVTGKDTAKAGKDSAKAVTYSAKEVGKAGASVGIRIGQRLSTSGVAVKKMAQRAPEKD
jgi:hypothetical protein